MTLPKSILEALRSEDFRPISRDDVLKYGFLKSPQYHFSGINESQLHALVDMIMSVILNASLGLSNWCPVKLYDYTNGTRTVMITEENVSQWLWSQDAYLPTGIENPLYGVRTLYARKGYDPVKHRVYVSRLICTMIVDGYMKWWKDNNMKSIMMLPLVSKKVRAAIADSRRNDWYFMLDDFDSSTCWMLECLYKSSN